MKATSSNLPTAELDLGGERQTLVPEVSHFLVQLSIALHRTVTYPRAHPTLEAAISALTLRLHRLLADRPVVSVGVARDCLLVDGAVTDPRNEVLRGLAESLHRHQVGAIRFHRGISSSEVSGLLAGLGADARQVGPFGIQDSEARSRWPSIHVESAAFDDLELKECSATVARAERAWLALAAAALLHDPDDETLENVEGVDIAEAIRRHVGDVAYGGTIARYMAQVGRELADLRGTCPRVVQQMGSLVSAMGEETLQILLEVGSDPDSRNRMVRDLTGVLPARSAIALTRAASVASTQAISHALLRLFTKMATNSESRTGTTSAAADAALRDSIRRLVDGWTLSDPNPGPYRDLLRYLTRAGGPGEEREEVDASTDALRLVELSIEAGAVGEAVWRAIDEILEAGHLDQILDRLDHPPGEATAQPLRRYLVQPDRLKVILDSQQPRQAVDRLLQMTGEEAADVLLESLGSADSRATRRQIIARLQTMGEAIAGNILARLERGPWYVQRNMLLLISQLERIPASLPIGTWLSSASF